MDQDIELAAEINGSQKETVNSSNPFVADVIKHCLTSQDIVKDHPITLRDNLKNKKITFSMLEQLTDEISQVDNGVVRYLIIGGWARELLLQAEELNPLDSKIPFSTRLISGVSNIPVPFHGDIDYISMTSENLMTKFIWEKYSTDGGKSSAPVQLLYSKDFSRRQPGTNQPDPGALEKYCCKVIVQGNEFIVPRPEVLFLEYAYYKEVLISPSVSKDLSENQKIFNWANFLIEINKKYSFDIDFLESTRKELIGIGRRKIDSGITELNEFEYLDRNI